MIFPNSVTWWNCILQAHTLHLPSHRCNPWHFQLKSYFNVHVGNVPTSIRLVDGIWDHDKCCDSIVSMERGGGRSIHFRKHPSRQTQLHVLMTMIKTKVCSSCTPYFQDISRFLFTVFHCTIVATT